MWLFSWLTWLVIGTIVMVLGYMLFSDAYRYETLMTAGVTAFILLVSLTQRRTKMVAQTV
ncbi:GABA permease [compost metagenome]